MLFFDIVDRTNGSVRATGAKDHENFVLINEFFYRTQCFCGRVTVILKNQFKFATTDAARCVDFFDGHGEPIAPTQANVSCRPSDGAYSADQDLIFGDALRKRCGAKQRSRQQGNCCFDVISNHVCLLRFLYLANSRQVYPSDGLPSRDGRLPKLNEKLAAGETDKLNFSLSSLIFHKLV